jgi:hypothetical protein
VASSQALKLSSSQALKLSSSQALKLSSSQALKLSSLILCLSPCVLGCSASAPSADQATTTTPTSSKLNILKDNRHITHDFGIQLPGTTVHHDFIIKNDSAHEWEFEQVHSSCGCAIPKVSQRVIAPGGQASVTVDYTVPNSIGDDQRGLSVSFVKNAPVHRLYVAAKVRNHFTLLPIALKAEANFSQDLNLDLYLCAYRPDILTPPMLACTADWLELGTPVATDQPTDDKAVSRRWKASVRVRSTSMKPGRYQAQITAGPVPGQAIAASIPVEIVITPPVQLSTSQLFFGPVSINQERSIEFTAKLAPKIKPTELKISSDLGSMLTISQTSEGRYLARLKPTGPPRILKGVLRIEVDQLPTTDIPVFARVEADAK